MNILAIGAHPDDVALNCSGTLKRYIDRGDHVYICTVSNGCYGSTTIEPYQLAKIRVKEDKTAASTIGASHYFNLGISDQFIDANSREQVDKLVNVIRIVRPDLIITHNPDDYHRDHVQTYHLVFRASCAASLHFWNDSKETPMCPIYLMDNFSLKGFEPTEYVDITEHIELKESLMPIYDTQYFWMRDHDHLDLQEYVEACAKVRGYQCGVEYAEGFRPDSNYGRMVARRLLP